MKRPLSTFIGLRYVRAKRRNHFISFITFISMLGFALGVAALITVLSVMNGFERELRTQILGMASHATIRPLSGALTDWLPLAVSAAEHPGVLGVAPYVQGEAMLSHSGAVRGVAVRGVLPSREEQVSEIGRYLVEGSLDDLEEGAYGVLIGRGLARALGASVGSRVTLIAPQTTVSPAGILPRIRRFTVAGIFEVNHHQYDTGIAVLHLDDAARLFRLAPGVSGLRIKVDDIAQAPRISHQIASALEGAFWVSDWTRHHRNFFRALETERMVMFVILSLIVAVAAFNIVSTLIMVVTDKQSDIAILRTLGATPHTVMRIFVVQGSVIGVIGTLAGVLGGIALAANVETLVPAIERLFETKFLSEEVYYIAEVPSELRRENVALIALVACVMSVVATLYPAWQASRVQPAEALRHE